MDSQPVSMPLFAMDLPASRVTDELIVSMIDQFPATGEQAWSGGSLQDLIETVQGAA